MRVLLHTPLKSPDSATPSGDREMARGLRRLLRRLGHSVAMPALSRVAPGVPSPHDHLALERRARRQAAQLVERWRALPPRHPERFDLWLTYHCYYRSPTGWALWEPRLWTYRMSSPRLRTRRAAPGARPASAIAPSSARWPPPTWC